eukprot:TRINITY_DN3656_c0_g2_i1.p1 TRINITY_DN3656_c0_g2~~TRINITY_DN3656_c0_g2_i1.p1  ORF type:complete len:374 (+),score=34.82 TRINITY_DN3656_c0_g2_i1:38-1123(+)
MGPLRNLSSSCSVMKAIYLLAVWHEFMHVEARTVDMATLKQRTISVQVDHNGVAEDVSTLAIKRLHPRRTTSHLVAKWAELLKTRSHDAVSVKESDGFMIESDEQWTRRKERQKDQSSKQHKVMTTCSDEYYSTQRKCMPKCREYKPMLCQARVFYQVHYEPSFSCLDARRLGSEGEGGKWVCDPYKLTHQAEQGNGCLVYSVGSNGDYSFEKAVHDEISPLCEIHTIDMNDWREYTTTPPPSYVSYHQYTVGPEPDTPVSAIIHDLGHTNRTIDIFKIDCEGCEWTTFQSWFGEGVNIRQIQVELHGKNHCSGAHSFFDFLFNKGYVVFSKEPNTLGPTGSCIEYSFLKLSPSFSLALDV